MVVDGIKVRCKLTESREGGTRKVTVKYCVGYDADDPKAVNAWPQYGCANSSPMTRSLRAARKRSRCLRFRCACSIFPVVPRSRIIFSQLLSPPEAWWRCVLQRRHRAALLRIASPGVADDGLSFAPTGGSQGRVSQGQFSSASFWQGRHLPRIEAHVLHVHFDVCAGCSIDAVRLGFEPRAC